MHIDLPLSRIGLMFMGLVRIDKNTEPGSLMLLMVLMTPNECVTYSCQA